jgi:hypothetical protein
VARNQPIIGILVVIVERVLGSDGLRTGNCVSLRLLAKRSAKSGEGGRVVVTDEDSRSAGSRAEPLDFILRSRDAD